MSCNRSFDTYILDSNEINKLRIGAKKESDDDPTHHSEATIRGVL